MLYIKGHGRCCTQYTDRLITWLLIWHNAGGARNNVHVGIASLSFRNSISSRTIIRICVESVTCFIYCCFICVTVLTNDGGATSSGIRNSWFKVDSKYKQLVLNSEVFIYSDNSTSSSFSIMTYFSTMAI